MSVTPAQYLRKVTDDYCNCGQCGEASVKSFEEEVYPHLKGEGMPEWMVGGFAASLADFTLRNIVTGRFAKPAQMVFPACMMRTFQEMRAETQMGPRPLSLVAGLGNRGITFDHYPIFQSSMRVFVRAVAGNARPIPDVNVAAIDLCYIFIIHGGKCRVKAWEDKKATESSRLTKAVYLFGLGEGSLAPCKAMELVDLCARRDFSVEILGDFLMAYGAHRADDVLCLVRDGLLPESAMEMFTENPLLLAHCPTYGDMAAMLKAWRSAKPRPRLQPFVSAWQPSA